LELGRLLDVGFSRFCLSHFLKYFSHLTKRKQILPSLLGI